MYFPEEADVPFSDILQTKGTNGVIQIPRAITPVKPQKHTTANDPCQTQTTHLPRVADKYVLGNKRTVPTKTSYQKSEVKSAEKENAINNDTRDIAEQVEKLSVTDTTNSREEPFRQRASTFPGKTQRPSIKINKLVRDNSGKENSEQSSPTMRIYKSKTEHEDRRSVRRDSIPKSVSPVFRQSSPYQNVRESVVSPTLATGRTSRNSQPLAQFRKHSAIQRRIANSQKAREHDGSRDSMHDDEVSAITKRPIRINRFLRAQIPSSNSNNETIMEQVSEITCPTPRPVSSLNVTAQSNFRSATPVLPSLGK